VYVNYVNSVIIEIKYYICRSNVWWELIANEKNFLSLMMRAYPIHKAFFIIKSMAKELPYFKFEPRIFN
jgi:hypothetical protein